MGTVIQVYAAATTGDNVASVDVPADGSLVGCDWAITAAASGADFTVAAQLSFGSSSQFTTNDGRAAISTIRVGADLTTSGAAGLEANKYVSLPNLPVSMGERIFLHYSATAALTVTTLVYLHFDFDLGRPRTRLR